MTEPNRPPAPAAGPECVCDVLAHRNVTGRGAEQDNGAVRFQKEKCSDLSSQEKLFKCKQACSGSGIRVGRNSPSDLLIPPEVHSDAFCQAETNGRLHPGRVV